MGHPGIVDLALGRYGGAFLGLLRHSGVCLSSVRIGHICSQHKGSWGVRSAIESSHSFGASLIYGACPRPSWCGDLLRDIWREQYSEGVLQMLGSTRPGAGIGDLQRHGWQ